MSSYFTFQIVNVKIYLPRGSIVSEIHNVHFHKIDQRLWKNGANKDTVKYIYIVLCFPTCRSIIAHRVRFRLSVQFSGS